MRRTALALSPHLDDAAFSCGGTLAWLARSGWRVVVATMFTQTVPNPQGFALACQLDKGLSPDVDYMALRRDEDVAAMQALGVEAPRHVELPEAPHRGYASAAALFAPPRLDDHVAKALRAEVERLVEAERPDLILAPQAIGGHVDHVQLVRALDLTAGPILWWCDYPYAIRPDVPHRPFEARFAALPRRTITLDDPALAAREAACAAYVTQIGYQFGGLNALRAKLAQAGPAETFSGRPDPFPAP